MLLTSDFQSDYENAKSVMQLYRAMLGMWLALAVIIQRSAIPWRDVAMPRKPPTE